MVLSQRSLSNKSARSFSLQLDTRWVKQILHLNDNIDGIMADEPMIARDQSEEVNAFREMAITEDDPRFRPDEMIVCRACGRGNPPTRLSCLYCGAGIDVSQIRTDLAQINFQRPEQWEDGFSVVYIGKEDLRDEIVGSAAEVLRMGSDELVNLVSVGTPVPVAYLRSLPDADLLASRLMEAGFECAILGDDLLTPQAAPTRVRSIEFYDEGLILEDFNNGNKIAIGFGEHLLVIVGTIFKIRSETTGKRSKKSVKITDASETLSDETVIDIYPPADVLGFRVRSNGFDFSCLGERMRKIAFENMTVLVDRLSEAFPKRILRDEYPSTHSMLDVIWPLESQNQSSEVKRETFGGIKIEKVTIADNTKQFTRYSRLQRHLI